MLAIGGIGISEGAETDIRDAGGEIVLAVGEVPSVDGDRRTRACSEAPLIGVRGLHASACH